MKLVTEEKIINIINKNNNNIQVTQEQIDIPFESLGIDSIEFVRIIVELEDFFECEFPDEKLIMNNANTVKKIFMILADLLNC